MDLVGVQRGIDFEHSSPTVMRYKPDIREGYTYASFEPKYGHTPNWQPLCNDSSDLHKEIVLACKQVAKVTEMKNPIGNDPFWHDSGLERAATIVSKIIDEDLCFDGFSKIDFIFDHAVASVKVGKAAKAEGELIITGTKGYIYVPAPWWKTDYFEVRFENPTDNKRYFYQLDGEGIRYEIVAFAKAIESGKGMYYINNNVSEAIINVIESYYNRSFISLA